MPLISGATTRKLGRIFFYLSCELPKMKNISELVSILNLIGLSGVAFFIYWTYKGLRERIRSLTQLAEEQGMTLNAVRERAAEFDALRKTYREALNDYAEMENKLSKLREKVVLELEGAIQERDSELLNRKQGELKELDQLSNSLNRIPVIENKLNLLVGYLNDQVEIRKVEIDKKEVEMKKVLIYTIGVLEDTKKIFKSKTLSDLREELKKIVENEYEP